MIAIIYAIDVSHLLIVMIAILKELAL